MGSVAVTVSRALQRFSRMGSPLVRWILEGRAHFLISGRLLLISFTGRRTGRVFTTPVSYVRAENELLVPGGGGWWKNLASGQVSVRLQGARLPVTPEVVTDPQALADLLSRMMGANPALSVLTAIRRGPDGRPDPNDLKRERARGFVVVRLHMPAQVEAKVA